LCNADAPVVAVLASREDTEHDDVTAWPNLPLDKL